ncbi:hypothetical protein M948_05015 [Virgibacillus sp. CM-4]|uniref:Uncharacterized protein n=1 Tax=Virgibacillus massiliensis TaxID=1462526 RepID=A0A024Q8G4_9BACI|nr:MULTISPECIES: hypothetical protein [Virgibacillus]EQB37930.1 hypothetical protein M948_05015 [Virgibacillus sp. CM-4]CDQ38557.1 hypothetical protein BN990_00828 [Virgibacillus massiliensis]
MIQGYRNTVTVTAPSFKAGAAFYLKAHLLFFALLLPFLYILEIGEETN